MSSTSITDVWARRCTGCKPSGRSIYLREFSINSKIGVFFASTVLFLSAAGFATAAIDAPAGVQNTGKGAATATAQLSAGEVRKVDLEQGKLTIKHEALENLGMPGMTMVFKVSDATRLKDLKQGDKIMFRAEKLDTGLTVVKLEQAK